MFHSLHESSNSWRFIYLPKTQSTHSVAKTYISNASPNSKIAVFTDHQTDGIGQYGREWSSEASHNLTTSLVFPFNNQQSFTNPFLWNMYVANVVHQAITQYAGANLSIKWPNDIIINGRKVGGILVNNTFTGSYISGSVVGIGINVNQTVFDNSLPHASSLKLELGLDYNPLELLLVITSTFLSNGIVESINENSEMILNLYNKNLYKRGENITCQDSTKEVITGILQGVNAQGNLVLASNQAEVTLKHGNHRQLLN